mgnify:CR=1 FL=1
MANFFLKFLGSIFSLSYFFDSYNDFLWRVCNEFFRDDFSGLIKELQGHFYSNKDLHAIFVGPNDHAHMDFRANLLIFSPNFGAKLWNLA